MEQSYTMNDLVRVAPAALLRLRMVGARNITDEWAQSALEALSRKDVSDALYRNKMDFAFKWIEPFLPG